MDRHGGIFFMLFTCFNGIDFNFYLINLITTYARHILYGNHKNSKKGLILL